MEKGPWRRITVTQLRPARLLTLLAFVKVPLHFICFGAYWWHMPSSRFIIWYLLGILKDSLVILWLINSLRVEQMMRANGEIWGLVAGQSSRPANPQLIRSWSAYRLASDGWWMIAIIWLLLANSIKCRRLETRDEQNAHWESNFWFCYLGTESGSYVYA